MYTKGFLRNYGTFLGLDPEYLVDLYRLETGRKWGGRAPIGCAAAAHPRATLRAFVVTPGAIAAAMLTVAVVAFVGYLVYEFVTFARTPDLQLTDPAGDVANYHELEYTIEGTTEPNATVTVDGREQQPGRDGGCQRRLQRHGAPRAGIERVHHRRHRSGDAA